MITLQNKSYRTVLYKIPEGSTKENFKEEELIETIIYFQGANFEEADDKAWDYIDSHPEYIRRILINDEENYDGDDSDCL